MSAFDQSGHGSREIRREKHLTEVPFRIAALTQLHPATALMANASREIEMISMKLGGGSGIRTHVTVSRKHAFQACAFSHSATPPDRTFLNAAPPLPQPPFLIGYQRHILPRAHLRRRRQTVGSASGAQYIGGSSARNRAPGRHRKLQPHVLVSIFLSFFQRLTVVGLDAHMSR